MVVQRGPLKIDDLRRHVVAAQGFLSGSSASDVIRRLACVQLDSISVVERSHNLVLASRGVKEDVSPLLAMGDVFEYWAHEACLVPVEDWPIFKRRMRERKEHHWWGPVIQKDPVLARRVLRTVRDKGPIRSSDFEGRSGGLWDHKPEKRMLDALWTAGKLVIVGRPGFQRLYDLPERVIPEDLLDAPTPTPRQFVWELALRAISSRGALTERGVAEHYRLKDRPLLKRVLASLVRDGLVETWKVEDGKADVFLPAGSDPESAPEGKANVLLSPFENMLWDRPFALRVFGFDHLIEVYKPEPQRRWGYYSLPLLMGDRIVARGDFKADRDEAKLVERAWHWEGPSRPSRAAKDAKAEAIKRLASTVLVPT